MRASNGLVAVAVVMAAGVVGCDCSGDRGLRPGGRLDGGGIDTGLPPADGAVCAAGEVLCGEECTNLSWDHENCGSCGNACPAGQVCSEGACGDTCGGARPMRCGDLCVDPMTDPGHCGGCDMPCASGLFCEDGACRLSCGEFADQCGEICTDVRSDPLNCGVCGNICPTPPHATPTCMDSTCGYVCEEWWGDCDALAENGCETSLRDDVNNCGSCDNVCPAPERATATCMDGMCDWTCDPPFELVDGECVGTMTDCYEGPARILVYGPGGRIGVDLIPPADAIITIANEAMWAAMTTADFGQYDILWIDGNSCGGAAGDVYGTLQDTMAAWGPAVTGRVVLMIGDPDLHSTEGTPWSRIWYTNNAAWLKRNGRNTDGGHTSLFMNWGCTIFNSNTMGLVPGRGTPEMFTAAFGGPLVTDTTNYCFGVTAATGVGHPVTAGMDMYWSCAMHGGFSSYPPDYIVLANGAAGGAGNCAIARDPFPCEAE